MDQNMNDQIKIVSLGVIALSLVVQTVVDIVDMGSSPEPAFQQQQAQVQKPNPDPQSQAQKPQNPQQRLKQKLNKKRQNNQQSKKQKPQRPQTSLKFNAKSHDFGTIAQQQKVRQTFEFTNTGKNPLVINNAKGSCGCTVPEYPKKPIPPGEKGQIVVEYSSGKRKGVQRNSVTINANTKQSPHRLQIKANVSPEAQPSS